MQKYEKIDLIGEGAYGVVWKCRHMDTKELVAIKKFKESEEEDENVKKTTMRQIKILRMLDHPNAVKLKQALRKKGIVFLIFQYCPYNLLEIIQRNQNGLDFRNMVKQTVYQILKGICHMHSLNIMHRDIKPQNILISDNGKLNVKICDFGFAKQIKSRQYLTEYVATRWYRAPQLLVGAPYQKAVDLWAVGCLFGQLIDGNPLYPGADDFDQLYLIQKSLGHLNQEQYQTFIKNNKYLGKKLPEINSLDSLQKRYYGRIDNRGIDLLKKLLKLSPTQRITASFALKHPYFDSVRQHQSLKNPQHQTRVISACDFSYNNQKKRQYTGYVHDDEKQATLSSIYASKNSKSQFKKKDDNFSNSTYLKVGLRQNNGKPLIKNSKKNSQKQHLSQPHKHTRGSSKTQMNFYTDIAQPYHAIHEFPSKMSINKIYGSNHVKQSIRLKSLSKRSPEHTQQPPQFYQNPAYSSNNQTPFILFGSNQQRKKQKSKSRQRQRPNINIVINNNTWMQPGSIVINR